MTGIVPFDVMGEPRPKLLYIDEETIGIVGRFSRPDILWPDGDVRTLYDPKVRLSKLADSHAFPPASGLDSWNVLSSGWLFVYAVRSKEWLTACHAVLLDTQPSALLDQKFGKGDWVYLGVLRCNVDNFTLVEWADKAFKRKKLEEAAKSLSR